MPGLSNFLGKTPTRPRAASRDGAPVLALWLAASGGSVEDLVAASEQVEADRDGSAVFMLHLLRARKRLQLLGDDLAQHQKCSATILVGKSLPKLVQIQCGGSSRRRGRRMAVCNPCMVVLLEGR